MEACLKEKITLVSGSSRGIGRAIAYAFLKAGAVVYVTASGKEFLEKTVSGFHGEFGDRVFSFCGDLTKTDVVQNLMKEVSKNHRRLDIVTANLGTGKSTPGWDVDDEAWMESFAMNFFSAVRLSREALKIMTKQKSGSIVFISSIAGCEAIPAPLPYSSAKAALLSYMKNLSNLAAPHGVRVNAVSPGNIYFEGGTWDRKLKENKETVEKYIQDAVPMRRMGKPEEIASAVRFLASDDASFITGANLVVDGGQIKKIM